MKKFNRKLISMIMSIVFASLGLVGSTLSASASTYKYGDINNDTRINSADALLVLKSSVGLKELNDIEFKCADVSGDGKVNSSDALLILKYSVSMISAFPADSKAPTDSNAILKLYSDAVANARSAMPAYTLKSITETKDVDVTLSGIMVSLTMTAEQKAQSEKQMEDETTQYNESTLVLRKDTANSTNSLPPLCSLTDASTLKSITCAKNDAGNYVINIKFKDEKNPKVGSSPIIKGLGVPDYDSMKAALSESNDTEDVKVTINSFDMTYKECWISCEINPISGEFVALHWYTGMPMTIGMTVIVGFDVSMISTSTIDYSYSNFEY